MIYEKQKKQGAGAYRIHPTLIGMKTEVIMTVGIKIMVTKDDRGDLIMTVTKGTLGLRNFYRRPLRKLWSR